MVVFGRFFMNCSNPDRKLDDALGGDDLGDLLGWLLDVLAREELQHGVSRDVDSDAIHEKCLGVAGAHGWIFYEDESQSQYLSTPLHCKSD